MIDPRLAGIKGFAFFGDTVLRAGTLPPAVHRADVTKTSKYSRFRANKKIGTFSSVTACSTRVAARGGREENRTAAFESSRRYALGSPSL
jgi:hypothetical protein